MARQALARRYRPRSFSGVAMQEHVSATLKSAVAHGRVAHAYLFAGPRGVGKTTAARVLAMALNCPNRGDDGEPCGECESCERIWAGRTSLDVIEIDAASNRGVDDARELRERAMYAPTEEDRYKIYILDEAHMLTKEAWNALLKIIEEPPPRVIFVFATTEPQKIQQSAPPILSRCQRFDFRRISTAGITERLREVVDAEGVEAGPEALTPIARRADGGMRDALSLLDQVLSFAERVIEREDVERVLGLVGEEVYLELFEIIAERRHADVFRFVDRIRNEGYDLSEFYRGLADALRTMLIVKYDGADVPEIRDDLRDTYADRAAAFEAADLLRMLAGVAELDADGQFRKSPQPGLLLEALLLRFVHQDRTLEIETLIRSAGGAPDGGGAPGGGRPKASPAAPASRPNPAPGAAGSAGGTGSPGDRNPKARSDAPAATSGERDSGSGSASAVRDASASSHTVANADDQAKTSAQTALHAVIEERSDLPPGLGILLKTARVAEHSGGRIVLELPAGPGYERLDSNPVARRALQSALGTKLEEDVEIDVRLAGSDDDPADRLTPDRVKSDNLARLTREEPLLDRAVKEWDLELLD